VLFRSPQNPKTPKPLYLPIAFLKMNSIFKADELAQLKDLKSADLSSIINSLTVALDENKQSLLDS